MADLLALGFMRQALLAAFLVGMAAPLVGAFLVQRRMSLIGDGIGHVALAGVAVGVLTGQMPLLTALVAAVGAAVGVELIRASGRTGGDVALALMFYGGIALGVVLISKSSASSAASLTSYLFGAILTTSSNDIIVFAVLAVSVTAIAWVFRQRFFAVAGDEDFARAEGMPVRAYNITLSVLAAVTVVVSMRVVGLLLITALMIIPNATAQLVSRSFRASLVWASVIGIVSSVGGIVVSFYAATPSGGTIVLLAIGIFLATTVLSVMIRRVRRTTHRRTERHNHEHGPACGHEAIVHGDHVDYLHDGHRHAPHADHYDDHSDQTQPRPRRYPDDGAQVHHKGEHHPPTPTRQRAALAELMADTSQFVSAQEAHAKLRARGDAVGLATVYRNLQAMVDDGELDVVRTDDGESVYRSCSSETHHHHLVCRECGRTVEVEGPTVEKWATDVARRNGFRDVTHTIELFGTCTKH